MVTKKRIIIGQQFEHGILFLVFSLLNTNSVKVIFFFTSFGEEMLSVSDELDQLSDNDSENSELVSTGKGPAIYMSTWETHSLFPDRFF